MPGVLTDPIAFKYIRLEKLTDFYLGWLAGIIDGEGCITLTNEGAPRVIVSMTTPLVTMLQQMTGLGSIRVSNRNPKSCKPLYIWSVYSVAGVYKLLSFLSPGILVKRKQCELMLKYCEAMLAKTSYLLKNESIDRTDFIKEMREINRRGGTDAGD